MSNYREQKGDIRPLVCNVASFTKPVGDTPSLLTMDEVETLSMNSATDCTDC